MSRLPKNLDNRRATSTESSVRSSTATRWPILNLIRLSRVGCPTTTETTATTEKRTILPQSTERILLWIIVSASQTDPQATISCWSSSTTLRRREQITWTTTRMVLTIIERRRRTPTVTVTNTNTTKESRRRGLSLATAKWRETWCRRLSSRAMTARTTELKVAKWNWRTTTILRTRCTLPPLQTGEKTSSPTTSETDTHRLDNQLKDLFAKEAMISTPAKMISEAERDTMERARRTGASLPVRTSKMRRSLTTRSQGLTIGRERTSRQKITSIRGLLAHRTQWDLETWPGTGMAQDQESTLTSAWAGHHWQANASAIRIASRAPREGIQEFEVATMSLLRNHLQDSKIQKISRLHRIWMTQIIYLEEAMRRVLATGAHTIGATRRGDTQSNRWTKFKICPITVIVMAVQFNLKMVLVWEVGIWVAVDLLQQALPHTTTLLNPRLAKNTLTSPMVATLAIGTEKFIRLISPRTIKKISKNRFKTNCPEFRKYSRASNRDK